MDWKFSGPKTFWTQRFLGTQDFWTQNFLATENSSGLKIFHDPKFGTYLNWSGSICLYFKEGERLVSLWCLDGVWKVSDRCLEVGWKVSNRCLKSVWKVTSLCPTQLGTNFYLELEFDSGIDPTCLV